MNFSAEIFLNKSEKIFLDVQIRALPKKKDTTARIKTGLNSIQLFRQSG